MRFSILITSLVTLLPIQAIASLQEGHYFQAIATNQVIKNELWNLVDGNKQEIYATKMLRSTDYAYDIAPSITFFADRIDSEGNPIPEAIAKIPDGATRLLLLFTKLKTVDENGLTYQVTVIKDDVYQFKFGSFRFINTTKKDVAILLEEERFLLEPSGMKTLEVQPPELGDLPVRIAVKDFNGEWCSNYSNGWGHRSNLRTLVFLVEGSNGRVNPLRFRQTEPNK